MKKIVTTVMIMICSLFMTGLMNNSVNAGQLDKNESYVLEKISEDKFPAKVQQRYINQLKNYFCQDDISLGKGEAEDFVKYLGEALSGKNGDTPKEMADSYIRFEKAGSAIGLLLSYDSRENVFYFTDSSGYIVLDFQDVVKNTGNEKSVMPTELIFTAIIGLCIIGLLLNFGRWGRKIRRNSDTYEDDEDESELEVANRRTRRARMQTFSYKAVKQILRYCFVPIIMGLIVIAAAALLVFLVVQMGDKIEGFRLARIQAWLNPESQAQDKGFQTLQALYAIGSGGIWGKGLGQSMQKLSFLPEAQNDMIFSIICEELGIFGAIAIILMFIMLLWRMMVIANNAPDLFGAMLVVGVMGHIAIQAILNIAVVTNSIPNTGISLPFISYGGSSALFLLSEIGLVLSVARRIQLKEL